MHDILISIIVPIYKVEKYLDECVQSIIKQYNERMEVILVDDGSPDNCGKMCDEYAKKYERIKVVHKENGGLSSARNAGLKIATGKYIVFVDSDDVVAAEYIEVLYNILKEHDAQISICSYIKSENADSSLFDTNNNSSNIICIEATKLLKKWHGKYKKVETVVWNKLYHKSILVDFPEGKIHEDIYVSHLIAANAKRIVITDKKLYIYRIRKSSITKTKATKESIRQDLDAQKARMKYFKDRHMYGSYLRCLKGHLLHRVKYMIVWKSKG